MSSANPDPRSFKSWEDAFQYPIPAIRGFEKRIRTQILENNERLRTLVGSSYRDLLGTAKTIVDANGQMQQVESLLLNLGRRSDSRILERIASNQSKLSRVAVITDTQRYQYASHIGLLKQALSVISKQLHSTHSSLLSAKLLVVARNLSRTMPSSENTKGNIRSLDDQIVFLRQRLLHQLDQCFSSSFKSPRELVEAMVAFSIATSSSAMDTVKHLQHLRLQAIKAHSSGGTLQRLDLYLITQRELRAVFPGLLQTSLNVVGSRPLLEDPDIVSHDELSLDLNLPWISENVKHFTLYSRHQVLEPSEVQTLFKSWTHAATQALLQEIGRDVSSMDDVSAIIRTRKEVIQGWLVSNNFSDTAAHRAMIDDLRLIFLDRIVSLSRILFLEAGDSTVRMLENRLEKEYAIKGTSPWSLVDSSRKLDNAALAFRNAVVSSRHGSDQAMDQILADLQMSWKSFGQFRETLLNLRDTKWETNDDIDDGDDESYDAQHVLSKEDPKKLETSHKENALNYVSRLESYIDRQAAATSVNVGIESPQIFLLRLVREIRNREPQLRATVNATERMFRCSSVITTSHDSLVKDLRQMAQTDLDRLFSKTYHNHDPVKGLWEGTPSLPVLCSRATFKFLRKLVNQMEHLGADLWTLDVVVELRITLHKIAADAVQAQVKTAERNTNVMFAPTGRKAESETSLNGHAPAHAKDPVIAGPDRDVHTAAIEAPDEEHHQNNGNTNGHVESDNASTVVEVIDKNENNAASGEQDQENFRQISEQSITSLVQIAFDAYYLDYAFPIAKATENFQDDNANGAVESALQAAASRAIGSANLPAASALKLRKNAGDYWRRTYLMFGLLCG